jgi:hypothetical protein
MWIPKAESESYSFQEVMKQVKRMCSQAAGCSACSLKNRCLTTEFPCRCGENYYAEIERIVMDWAKENPELRYPTWNEWYKATFPNSNYHTIPCPSMFYKICETSNYHGEVECYECKNQPIPADIAEKLGIKPIGGEE